MNIDVGSGSDEEINTVEMSFVAGIIERGHFTTSA
jgi:hypothetical protein